MGLIILLAVGAILGWLTSIVLCREDAREIGVNVGVGALGSIIGGALSSTVSVFGGLSALALLTAFVCAAIAIAALNLFRHGALLRFWSE